MYPICIFHFQYSQGKYIFPAVNGFSLQSPNAEANTVTLADPGGGQGDPVEILP